MEWNHWGTRFCPVLPTTLMPTPIQNVNNPRLTSLARDWQLPWEVAGSRGGTPGAKRSCTNRSSCRQVETAPPRARRISSSAFFDSTKSKVLVETENEKRFQLSPCLYARIRREVVITLKYIRKTSAYRNRLHKGVRKGLLSRQVTITLTAKDHLKAV